jgi:hypothetical protein
MFEPSYDNSLKLYGKPSLLFDPTRRLSRGLQFTAVGCMLPVGGKTDAHFNETDPTAVYGYSGISCGDLRICADAR